MESAEYSEEVTALRGGKWNARVAEQQREHRAEGSPQHEQCEDRRDRSAVDLLHEHRDDEVRCRVLLSGHELAPWYDADNREVDSDVNDCDGDGADQDRPWDDAPRIAHFVTDIADVVVAEVVVDADARRCAEAEEESEREVERAGWKVEGETRIEMSGSGENHRQHCDKCADPERDGDLGDRLDPPVQQRDVDQSHHGDQRDYPGPCQSRPEETGVLREADVPGRDLERPAQHELPDEEEGHESTEACSPKRFAQII